MTKWWNKMKTKIGNGKRVKRVGNDGSTSYTKNKKVAFYFYHGNSRNLITFKPFIDSISYKIQYEEGEEILKRVDGYLKKDRIKSSIGYSISLNLPAHSVNEAKLNLSKINQLKQHQFSNYSGFMSATAVYMGTYDDLYMRNMTLIFMSNIISNGNYTSSKHLSSHKEMLKYGVPGLIKDVKVDFQKDLGFFEEDGNIYPKLIKVSFDLDVYVEQVKKNSNKRLFTPYTRPGAYQHDDSKYWPFGITGFSSTSPVSSDGKINFADKKNTWFSLCNEEVLNTYAIFPLVLDNLSFTMKKGFEDSDIENFSFFNRKIKSSGVNDLDVSVSFSTIANSVNEARYYMYQIQKLVRLINLRPSDYRCVDKVSDLKTFSDWQSHYEKVGRPNNWMSKRKFLWEELTESEQSLYKKYASSRPVKICKWVDDPKTSTRYNHVHITNLFGRERISGRPNLESIMRFGHAVHIKSFSFEPDISLGFFDEDGMLYYKSFKISFEMTPIAESLLNKGTLPLIDSFIDPETHGQATVDEVNPSSVTPYRKIIKL